jgi:hypothetical protein
MSKEQKKKHGLSLCLIKIARIIQNLMRSRKQMKTKI